MSGEPTRRGTLPDQQVRAMFDRIAGRYDLMNSVMTAGLHDHWRTRAVDIASVQPGDRVLDVATGTGDLAFELAARVGPTGSVVGADFSSEMLAIARSKLAARQPGVAADVQFETADALKLPYEDNSFAAATVGFGVRNFADLDRGLRELLRVVRPGGKVVILEISQPTRQPLAGFYRFWFDRIVPLLGRVGGEDSAYTYLPDSVKRFPDPRTLAARFSAAGATDVRYLVTAGGIITIHSGVAA